MSPATPRTIDSSDATETQARIDAQDVSAVIPLREYLLTHGCSVFINESSPSDPTYWIVVGDEEYVKAIAETQDGSHAKKLHLIIDGFEPVSAHIKTTLLDPTLFASATVKELFSFFFTGRHQVLDLRKEKRQRPQQFNNSTTRQFDNATPLRQGFAGQAKQESMEMLERAREEQNVDPVNDVEDNNRIKQLMADLYAKPVPAPTKKQRSWRIIETKIGVILCLFLVAPVVWYLLSFAFAPLALVYAGKLLSDNNHRGSKQLVAAGRYWTTQGTLLLSVVRSPVAVLGGETLIRRQERVWSLYRDIAVVEEDAAEVATAGTTVAKMLLAPGGETDDAASTLVNVQTQVSALHTRVGLIEAEVRSLTSEGVLPFGLPMLATNMQQSIAKLGSIRTSLNMLEKFLSLYPRFSGFDKPKTYLVLLQNSMEIRPTGGFIGSLGVAKFEDGSLTDFTIQDVYDADGQLKGHVDPPPAVRDLLAQEHWYLRDSNMNPNFPESGARAAWFYEKEMGVAPDGVIAVSLPMVVDLLRATGPVELSDYDDRITADNFLGKAVYYTKNDFFPGSTQKKDFLGTLTRAIVLKITEGKTSPFALFTAVSHGLTAHDVQFYFAEHELEDLVTEYGWGGTVPSVTDCQGVGEARCMGAPLIITEANMSVNKESYFVKREWQRTITVTQEGTVSEDARLVYKNPLDHEPYTMYLTIAFPRETVVDDVRVAGVSVPRRDAVAKRPTPPYVEKLDPISGLFTIGLAVTIPPGAETAVGVLYTRASKLMFGQSGAILDVLTQKQAGLSDIPLTTTVRYPVYWLATNVGDRANLPAGRQGLVAKDGQFQYNTVLSHDQVARLQFQQ